MNTKQYQASELLYLQDLLQNLKREVEHAVKPCELVDKKFLDAIDEYFAVLDSRFNPVDRDRIRFSRTMQMRYLTGTIQ